MSIDAMTFVQILLAAELLAWLAAYPDEMADGLAMRRGYRVVGFWIWSALAVLAVSLAHLL